MSRNYGVIAVMMSSTLLLMPLLVACEGHADAEFEDTSYNQTITSTDDAIIVTGTIDLDSQAKSGKKTEKSTDEQTDKKSEKVGRDA